MTWCFTKLYRKRQILPIGVGGMVFTKEVEPEVPKHAPSIEAVGMVLHKVRPEHHKIVYSSRRYGVLERKLDRKCPK